MNELIDNTQKTQSKGLITAGWILISLAYLFLFIPFLGWLGWMLNLVAFILSIVMLAKGKPYTTSGVMILIMSTVGAGIVYGLSWLLVLAVPATAGAVGGTF